MGGQRLVVAGTVLTADCRRVRRALLDFWQADDAGQYDNQGYRLRGHQFSDDQGGWRLETVVPGLYTGRTRHIHIKVQAPDGPVLTTQRSTSPASRPTSATASSRPSCCWATSATAATGALASFTFVLAGASGRPRRPGGRGGWPPRPGSRRRGRDRRRRCGPATRGRRPRPGGPGRRRASMTAGSWRASTTSRPGSAWRGQKRAREVLAQEGGGRRSPRWRSRPKRAGQEELRVHWSWPSPPGVPKARQGLPSRRATDGLRVVRGRAPGRREPASPSSRPEHLGPGAEAEAEAGDDRRALQPAAAGGGRDQVAVPVGHVDVAGVAEGRLPDPSGRWRPPRSRSEPGREGRRGRARPATRGVAPATPRRRPGPGGRRRSPGRAGRQGARRRRRGRRTRLRGRRRRAWRTRSRCGRRRRCPGPSRPGRPALEQAQLLSSTGPWPQGPVLQTVQP